MSWSKSEVLSLIGEVIDERDALAARAATAEKLIRNITNMLNEHIFEEDNEEEDEEERLMAR